MRQYLRIEMPSYNYPAYGTGSDCMTDVIRPKYIGVANAPMMLPDVTHRLAQELLTDASAAQEKPIQF